MGRVISMFDYRKRAESYWNVACCMYCGVEFPWGQRNDHRCQQSSQAKHPSSTL